jgi:hypothetical protein
MRRGPATSVALLALPFLSLLTVSTPLAGPAMAQDAPKGLEHAFEKNTMVTDKKTYVHMLWNALDVRGRFSGAGRREALAEAACELVRRLYPAKASADLVKIDIVLVKERDGYGLPRWESLERLAHVEVSRARILEAFRDGRPAGELGKLFTKFEVR